MLNSVKLFTHQILILAISLASFAQDVDATTYLKKSSQSCSDTQTGIMRELRSKGLFIPYRAYQGSPQSRTFYPKMAVSNDEVQRYKGYPQARIQTLKIDLSGDYNKVSSLISSHRVYLSQVSARIMASCHRIGLVEFRSPWDYGEIVVPVGFFPDGTARIFQYTNNDRGEKLEWGYYTGD